VVTRYLSQMPNLKLRPKPLRELRPGARIVSHDFTMGDWTPERVVRVAWRDLYRTVYLWTIPERRRGHRDRPPTRQFERKDVGERRGN